MKLPITRKTLIDWAGTRVYEDAESLVRNGRVLEASYDEPYIKGSLLWNNRPFYTSLKVMSDGNVENMCPCRDNTERGIICAHVIALGVMLVERATDPAREEKYRAERRRASRVARVDEDLYIRRVAAGSPGALPASIRLLLPGDWLDDCEKSGVPLRCELAHEKKHTPIDKVGTDIPFTFSRKDEALLYVLEDIAGGPPPAEQTVGLQDFFSVLRVRSGKKLFCDDGKRVVVNEAKLITFLKMELDCDDGRLVLSLHTEVPFKDKNEEPVYIVDGSAGWLYAACNLWPLENVLPEPYQEIYRHPVRVERADVVRFLKQDLPLLSQHARIEAEVSPDLFTIDPAEPDFTLVARGSPASLSCTVWAKYQELSIIACKPDVHEHFAIPDPDDLMRYTVRNHEAERSAITSLAQLGLTGETGDSLSHVVGIREVLNFLGSSVPTLRRRGWHVELAGRAEPYLESLGFATPVVHIKASGSDWFDVGFDFESPDGSSLSQADIQRALRKQECFLKQGDRTILIDSEAIESVLGLFSDCACRESDMPGHFRMSNVYAGFVKASLDGLDGVDVEACQPWLQEASRYNRSMKVEPVDLGEPLNSTLRAYQREGINWLRFLEMNGFCGLLADEMGLGKTIQTLAWLQLERYNAEARGPAALVVCPTSLVENWTEEAARFVPNMKVLALTGTNRHEKWEAIDDVDLVVTSYALLRRDIDTYTGRNFSVVILDEAQHIKNRSTQNALAAKRIKAPHRLVLTGTPMENTVADLWSIMDFLMPGYLGEHRAFREAYELPIQHAGIDGEAAQARLRRKLHPFLLRRLKTDVARDLPPKIEKISFCSLSADQAMVYRELLAASRRNVSDMVREHGFNKSRMEILAALMKLRQACCHLDLLKLPDLEPEQPSAKMAQFFEFADEALDSGHRILVFSQFVSMLTILRQELENRDLAYCYLDGSTKNRMEVVHTFNTQRKIPFFLISLKAGGTGLNLTGADTVIHFDPWWNPAVEDQATDRAYRIGQKRTVYSIKLITRATVEEKVLALQRKKKAVIDATVESDEKIMQTLSWDDIAELLSL